MADSYCGLDYGYDKWKNKGKIVKMNAVIFDLDGTLIDSMGIWLDVDKEFLSKRNILAPENLFDDIKGGNSFIETAIYFKERFNLKETIQEIMNEWTAMVEEHYKNKVKLKNGVLNLLDYLKKINIKTAIGTSNSKYLCETVLKSNNVYEYFSVIIAGDDKLKGKPFPDIFLKAANKLGVEPEDCIVIEDTLSGILAAKNAKMKVCAVYDKHSKNKIKKIKKLADWFANDFAEVKKIIEENI